MLAYQDLKTDSIYISVLLQLETFCPENIYLFYIKKMNKTYEFKTNIPPQNWKVLFSLCQHFQSTTPSPPPSSCLVTPPARCSGEVKIPVLMLQDALFNTTVPNDGSSVPLRAQQYEKCERSKSNTHMRKKKKTCLIIKNHWAKMHQTTLSHRQSFNKQFIIYRRQEI